MEEITNRAFNGAQNCSQKRIVPVLVGKSVKAYGLLSSAGVKRCKFAIHSYHKARPECSSKPYYTYELHVKVFSLNSDIVYKWTVCRQHLDFEKLFKELSQLEDNSSMEKENLHQLQVPSLPLKCYSIPNACHRSLSNLGHELCRWMELTWNGTSNLSQDSKALIFEFLSEDINEQPPLLIRTNMIGTKSSKPNAEGHVCDPKVSSSNHVVESKSADSTGLRSNTRSLDHYEIVSVIGKGSFGQVLLAKRKRLTFTPHEHHSADNLFAIKVLDKDEMSRRKQVKRVLVERQCLEVVNSPFVVKLRYAFHDAKHVFLVQDYCPGGELYFRLETVRTLSVSAARVYIAECILALEHIHSLNIVYRDLKPENLMLDREGHIRLVDFGLAKMGVKSSVSGAKSFVGTTEYLAPEMIGRKGHGFAVDWWALGMVLYEMLVGLPPWYSEDRKLLVQGILRAPLVFKPTMSYQTRSLLSGLLERVPDVRLGSRSGARELKDHPFFRDIDWSVAESRGLKVPHVPSLTGAEDTKCFDPTFTRLPKVVDPPARNKGNPSSTQSPGFPGSKATISCTPMKNPEFNRSSPASVGVKATQEVVPCTLVESLHIEQRASDSVDHYRGFSFDGDL